MITTADHFNRAVTLWYELTGLDPNAKSWTMGSYGIKTMTDAMIEAMDYDPSFITTYLLLDAYSTSYFKDAKVSVHEFDSDPDKVFDYMDKVREFKKLIRDPVITQVADEFTEQTRKALLSYNVEAAKINEFLDNRSNLAYIRRDALKSINRLRADHFLQGEVDDAAIKPIYNREVFGYWNINSLIEHACSMPSGIALNLIRDPDELHSYFAFSLRNGGNVIMLTDIEEYAHPLGRYMSRRPDRAFDARTVRNWFPYQLLSIAYDEKGNPYHEYREAQAQGLIPHQSSHFVLEKLANIGVAEIVWTTLMFDLILEKYWRNPIPQKALSYTNEMIRLEDQNTLLASAATANLPVSGYQPLNLPRLTTKDVMTDALDERALGKRQFTDDHYGKNRWMEERYGHLIPEEALNQLGPPAVGESYLAFHDDKAHDKNWHSDTLPVVREEGGVRHAANVKVFDTRANPIYHLEKVDGTLFGTREQIDADRKFIARCNFAEGIQREADREFSERKLEIFDWWKERIESNIDTLLAYAHHDSIYHVRPFNPTFGGSWLDGDYAEEKLEKYRFSGMVPQKRDPEDSLYEFGRLDSAMHTISQGWVSKRGGYHSCYLTGAKPTWKLYMIPGSVEDLCLMTGCSKDELPEVLRHWQPGRDPYVGNSILSRIDPLEWRLDNPWEQASFAIRIYLSKRARAQIVKDYPAPPLPDISSVRMGGSAFNSGHNRSRVRHSNWKAFEEDN